MNYRRVIFITIVTFASLYSFLVYTWGTNNKNGQLLTEKAAHGKILWQEYNCIACHQLYGLGGYLGPDLTNEIKLKGPDYAKAFMTTGSVKMPNLHLTPSEIDDITEYLVCLSNSGEYPLSKPNITLWGDMNIKEAKQK
jgi:nitric oxide reductase subunit C